MTEQRVYQQIGVTALRDPVTREYLPAVPLYVEVTDAIREYPEMDIQGLSLAMRMAAKKAPEGEPA